MFRYIAIVITAGLLLCCGGKNDTLYPFGWEKVGEPFDSLTVSLERKFLDMASEKAISADVERLLNLAAADSSSMVKRARATYWHGRLQRRLGNYARSDFDFETALSLTDSAVYPYDNRRIRWNMEDVVQPLDAQWYNTLIDDADFFEKAGDCVLAADRYMCLGTMMNDLGDSRRALVMLDKADSLFLLAGLRGHVSKNRLNRANAFFCSGHSDEGEKILRELVEDPVFRADTASLNIAYCNLYAFCGDTAALRLAYGTIPGYPGSGELKCLYASFLTMKFLDEERLDSAMRYSDIAKSVLEDVEEIRYKKDFYSSRARLMNALGMSDSAYYYQAKFSAVSDTVTEQERDGEVLRLETLRQIAQIEKDAESAVRRHIIMLVIVVIFSSVVVIFVLRRLLKQRTARARTRSLLERSNRKMLALQLALNENDNIVNTMGQEVTSLKAKGDIPQAAMKSLESVIKTHKGLRFERDSFIESFSEINPEFVGRLKDSYPGLSDAEVRLAMFIALGLDNKHIARVLAIRPESVKQARWRLRSKMNIASGDSLDDVIKSFLQ